MAFLAVLKLILLPLIPVTLPYARRWATAAPPSLPRLQDVLSFCQEHQFAGVTKRWPADYLKGISLQLFDRIPGPPLGEWPVVSRFKRFNEFQELESAAMALPGKVLMRHDSIVESTLFHELVHTVQWRVLGPERFLVVYACGLLEHGYEDSPLEAMAYELEGQMRKRRKGRQDDMDEVQTVEGLTLQLLENFQKQSWINRTALWIAQRV